MSNHGAEQRSERDGSLGRALARLVLSWAGWSVDPFPDVPRAVVTGGPHTSNWDAVVGVLAGTALGLRPVFLIKKKAFRGPLGPLLRRFGGVPIDRSRHTGAVEQAVERFAGTEPLVMVVTPEGTRTNAPRWKTGFYHIAREAGVPIVVATADYARRRLELPLVLEPSGDLDADMQRIIDCFARVTPRHPEKLSAPVKTARERLQGK